MLTEKIKKLIYILLLSLVIYLIFLIFPRISGILNLFYNISKPFIIAFVFAFILQPIVKYIQKFVIKRNIAIIIVIILFSSIIFFFLKYIANTLVYEFEQFSSKFPNLIFEIEKIINEILNKIPILNNYQISLENIIENYHLFDDKLFTTETINKIISFGRYLLITPIILIYLLIDYEKIIENIKNYLIKNNKIRFKNYLSELNQTIFSYFRGVLLVMFILFMIFSIVFLILKIENGMVFALIIAITNIIPYIGSWIGTSIPVFYALLSSYNKALIVLIICIIIQTIEANILTPLIQEKNTKLHPLFIIFSLLLFGSIFGFIGMMFAVPIAVIIKITLKYYPINILKNNIQ